MTQTHAFDMTTIKLGLARAIALGAVALMMAAAIRAFVNSAPTRVMSIDAPPPPTIDPCNPNRLGGVWFPIQVEAEFAERCAK